LQHAGIINFSWVSCLFFVFLLPIAQQVQLEPPDGIWRHHISRRASKIERVEGTLHDAGATLHALFRPGQAGESAMVIKLKNVRGAYLLT